MLKKRIEVFTLHFIKLYQIVALIVSDFVCNIFLSRKKISAVVGVIEIAGYLDKLGSLIDNSYTVCFNKSNYYDYKYSYQINNKYNLIRRLTKVFISPLLLGYLINKSDNFIYTWSEGFLLSKIDSRRFEFWYLKFRKKKIICIFLGDDIRSNKLLHEYGLRNKIDTISTYRSYLYDYNLEEITKQNLSVVTDKYADFIFSYETDQISYLTRKTLPGFYILSDDDFSFSSEKFSNLETVVIIHAPTDPFIKGTQLIRSVIKRLQLEGHRLKYIELFNKTNLEVLALLKEAHIAINQLYAFVPSVFGIESMANHVALLTSADEEIEKDLPVGSNDAWVVTKYWNLYDKLLYLIDNPNEIEYQATKGYNYVLENYHISKVKTRLMMYLDKL